jgi:hypothetical protein
LNRFAIQSGETCSARDLGDLLKREFMSDYEAERGRLTAYAALKVQPSNDVVEAMEMPETSVRASSETFAQAVVSSGETQIFGMAAADSEDTRFQSEPVAPAATRKPPVRFVVENTPNLRKPQEPQVEGTRLLALAEDGPEPARGGAVEPSRVMEWPRARGEPTQLAPAPRSEKIVTQRSERVSTQESGGSSRSAARLSQPRFGRESVLVWLSTAVAIVLVMLAYWLSGQLNPSAKLLIDVTPKNAELVVNSKRMGPIAGKGGIEIAPGDVLVEVRAPGHCSWFRHLKLSAKETFSTRVMLLQKSDASGCP